MKSKEFFELMINPFKRIAGLQAFGVGLVFVILMGIIGTYGNTVFDGAIDMHVVSKLSLLHSFSFLAIDLFSVILVMWITGLIISKGFRFVDILGTITLAKAPFLLLAIVGLFTVSPDLNQILINPFVIFSSPTFILLIILSIPVLVWNITLMYNGLKISYDVKGNKLTISFIIALIISEIISKILIYLIA